MVLVVAAVACGSTGASRPAASVSPSPHQGSIDPKSLALTAADLGPDYKLLSETPASGSTAVTSVQRLFTGTSTTKFLSVVSIAVVFTNPLQAQAGLWGGWHRLLQESSSALVTSPMNLGGDAVAVTFTNQVPQAAITWTEGAVLCDVDVGVSPGRMADLNALAALAAIQDARVKAT